MTEAAYFSAGIEYQQDIPEGSTWANQIIKMNNVVNKNGIEYDTDTGIITLEKGQTYRVTSQLGIDGNGDKPYFYAFGLFNLNTEVQIGPLAEALQPGLKTRNASSGFLDVIHTAAESGKYCIRMASNVKADSTSHIRPEGTFLNIVQILPGTDILSARRVTNQEANFSWSAWEIIISSEMNSNGGIAFCNNSGCFTLKAHKTYRITAQLGWEQKEDPRTKSPGWYAFGLFDYDGIQFGTAAESLPPNSNTPNASGAVLDVIHTPYTTGKFHLRMTKNNRADASSTIRADVSTFLTIVSIPEEKSYMSARRFVDQTLLPEYWQQPATINMHIAEKRGTIGYSPDYGEIKLKGGRTYRITAQVGIGAKLPGCYKFVVDSDDVSDDEKFLPFSVTVSPNFPVGRPVSSGVYDIILSPWRDIRCYCVVEPDVVGYQSIIRASTSTFLNVVEL